MVPVYLSLFLVGLLGGVHCVGMCGGIVGALAAGSARWSLQLAYNLGRIGSYALAGALVGGLGFGLSQQWELRVTLYIFANLMLVALALYLMGVTRVLAPVERFGSVLWRRVHPLTKRYVPARHPLQALQLGALWGWLPCGMVYSALVTAMSTGSPAHGAVAMVAFGFGTLPNLLLAGLLAVQLQRWTRRPAVRIGAGLAVMGFALHGLFGAWRLTQTM